MPSSTPATWWPAPAATGPISATITLPGSKSLTNRFLIVAALADRTSILRSPLVARDTVLMRNALRAMGTTITEIGADQDREWVITPGEQTEAVTVDCGLSGTILRFLPPVAALSPSQVRFAADAGASRRPMAVLHRALADLGVPVQVDPAGIPFTVTGQGHVTGGPVTIDASASSQFVSGLLLAGARMTDGLTLTHAGPPVPSLPHIEMTCDVLRDVGVVVDHSAENQWHVEPGAIHELDVVVEPDLSNAAPFLAAAALTGGSVLVRHWPQHTTQAGDHLRAILSHMGATMQRDRHGLRCTGPDQLTGVDLDLSAVAELLPVLAAVATGAHGPSRFTGIGHVRGHETDRLAALSTQLQAAGAHVEVSADAITVTPGRPRAHDVATYHDHRMAQVGAVLGLLAPGTRVENMATTAKTLPGFGQMWHQLVSGATQVAPAAVASEDLLAR